MSKKKLKVVKNDWLIATKFRDKPDGFKATAKLADGTYLPVVKAGKGSHWIHDDEKAGYPFVTPVFIKVN